MNKIFWVQNSQSNYLMFYSNITMNITTQKHLRLSHNNNNQKFTNFVSNGLYFCLWCNFFWHTPFLTDTKGHTTCMFPQAYVTKTRINHNFIPFYSHITALGVTSIGKVLNLFLCFCMTSAVQTKHKIKIETKPTNGYKLRIPVILLSLHPIAPHQNHHGMLNNVVAKLFQKILTILDIQHM